MTSSHFHSCEVTWAMERKPISSARSRKASSTWNEESTEKQRQKSRSGVQGIEKHAVICSCSSRGTRNREVLFSHQCSIFMCNLLVGSFIDQDANQPHLVYAMAATNDQADNFRKGVGQEAIGWKMHQSLERMPAQSFCLLVFIFRMMLDRWKTTTHIKTHCEESLSGGQHNRVDNG